MEENNPKILFLSYKGHSLKLRKLRLKEDVFNTTGVAELVVTEEFPVVLFPSSNLSGAICQSLKDDHDRRLRQLEWLDSGLIVAPSNKTKGKHHYPFYHTGKY